MRAKSTGLIIDEYIEGYLAILKLKEDSLWTCQSVKLGFIKAPLIHHIYHSVVLIKKIELQALTFE